MTETTESKPALYLTDKQYNTLKPIVQVGLPAISSLYFGLSAIWGLPGAEQVVGTIALITTFLGVTLGLSSRRYNTANPSDGQIVITQTENGAKNFSLELDKTPEEIEKMKSVTFDVTDKESAEGYENPDQPS